MTFFTAGTMIATPDGLEPVERLSVGDRVLTRDTGVQKIRWTGRRHLGTADLHRRSHLRPIAFAVGSLGGALPDAPMMTGPNMRLLVNAGRSALAFDQDEALVAAKHLIDNRDIRIVEAPGIDAVHFFCARHEVVMANGTWVESFHPAFQRHAGSGNAQRNDLFEIFPELKSMPETAPRRFPALRFLSGDR